MVVLIRRSRHRLAKVVDRLEVLEGYLKAFLDLDEVIRIIREEDEPKPALMARFELTDRQAEAILNLRLRNLRKLEEMELARASATSWCEERQGLEALLADEGTGGAARLKEQFLAARKQFGGGPLGKRRTELAEAPAIAPELLEEPVERVSGHRDLLAAWAGSAPSAVRSRTAAELKYKEGDGERFLLPAQSSDRLLVLAADGRVYTLAVDKLAGGRGQGEPLSLAIDLEKGVEIVDLRVHRPEGRLVFATRKGFGFVAEEKEIAAQTRAGRQVVNLERGRRAAGGRPGRGRSPGAGRQQPQAADLPGGRAAGPGARQGGHADEAEGCRARRPAHVRPRPGPELECQRPRAPGHRPRGLARPARRCRQDGADRVPAEQPVRVISRGAAVR